jgi:hypothetical protein
MRTDIQTPRPAGLASASGYMLAERNIHLTGGKYRVLITRRPKNLYGGRFADLSAARKVRDELEKTVAPRKPWGIRGHMVEVRRTTQQRRKELRADGLCQVCGD